MSSNLRSGTGRRNRTPTSSTVTATKVGNNDSGRNRNRAAPQKKTDKPQTV